MKKSTGVLLSVFLILALGGSTALFVWKSETNRADEEVRRLARENSFPMTPAEMFPVPTVAPERNAFHYVGELAAAEKEAGRRSKWDSNATDADALRALLTDRTQSLELLEKMTDLDDWQPHRTGPSVHAVLFPEFATVKQGAKLLVARAELRAHDGDFAGCLTDLKRAAKLARFMDHEPVLIGGLVKVAVQNILAGGVARILPHALEPSDRPAQLLAVLDEPGPFNYYNHLHEEGGAFASIAVLKEDLSKELPILIGSQQPLPAFYVAGFQATQPKWGPRLVRDYAEAMRTIKNAPTDTEVAQASLAKFSKKYSNPLDVEQAIGNIMAPVFEDAVDATRKPGALKSMLICAADALQHHRDPDVFGTHDPYARNQPLKTLKTQSGWMVYSIGSNRLDDHGKFDSTGKPLDIVLEWDGKQLWLNRQEK